MDVMTEIISRELALAAVKNEDEKRRLQRKVYSTAVWAVISGVGAVTAIAANWGLIL